MGRRSCANGAGGWIVGNTEKGLPQSHWYRNPSRLERILANLAGAWQRACQGLDGSVPPELVSLRNTYKQPLFPKFRSTTITAAASSTSL